MPQWSLVSLAGTDASVCPADTTHRVSKRASHLQEHRIWNADPAGIQGRRGALRTLGAATAARGPPSLSLERGTRTALLPSPVCREESPCVVSRGHPARVPPRRPARCRTDARMSRCRPLRQNWVREGWGASPETAPLSQRCSHITFPSAWACFLLPKAGTTALSSL